MDTTSSSGQQPEPNTQDVNSCAQSQSAAVIFTTFLRLGLTSFGGPIAHLGYFRQAFVEQKRWLSESQFAQLLAISQFLPGPASSQVGFGIGLVKGGWLGALAAFTAFTAPSVLLLILFATMLPLFGNEIGGAFLHGLKLVALVVVAHGLRGMLAGLCPDPIRKSIAVGAAVLVLLADTAFAQLAVVAVGAVLGGYLCRDVKPTTDSGFVLGYSAKLGWVLVSLFLLLLFLLPFIPTVNDSVLNVFQHFYQSGALVFGGGHVVLPLLEEAVVSPGWVTESEFLAGYGAAQAVPGPMFSFAAYLGQLQGGFGIAITALLAIFIPGFLLLGGMLPIWHQLARGPKAARAVAGVNAAVVGLLGAALYDPIFTTAITSSVDVCIAIVGLLLITTWNASALWIVAWCVVASLLATAVF